MYEIIIIIVIVIEYISFIDDNKTFQRTSAERDFHRKFHSLDVNPKKKKTERKLHNDDILSWIIIVIVVVVVFIRVLHLTWQTMGERKRIFRQMTSLCV
jgi:hypothetical protein